MNNYQNMWLAQRTGKSARAISLACVLAFSAALSACGAGDGGGGPPPPEGAGPDGLLRVAANPHDEWKLVPAAEVGMDAAVLAKAVSTLPPASQHGISSMLVMRHGKPVLEQYWNGYDKDTLHDLRSATKSITSLLMGIAIDQRMVGSVNDTLASHLGTLYPDAPAYRLGLTLSDMLTMRSGLDCDDWTGSSPGNEENMYRQGDWVRFYTGLQAIRNPGTVTRYCTGNPVALGRVIAQAANKPVPAFASEFLFGPLNIQSARWAQYDNGRQTDTGGHIYMRPRDMAKLGQLALQKGMWNGRQLVSAAWLDESMRHHTRFANQPERGGHGYGYLWWRRSEAVNGQLVDIVYASGNGGQFIAVVPELDVVAVFTGENYNANSEQLPFDAMRLYVLAAIK